MGEQVKMTVDLAYAEGKNKNGWSMPKEVLKGAIEKANEAMEKGYLMVMDSYNLDKDLVPQCSVQPERVIGKLVSVDLDNLKADIVLNKPIEEGIYHNCPDKKLALFFSYACSTERLKEDNSRIVTDATIMYSALMPKHLSAYNFAS